MGNAAKFTKEGEIELSVAVEGKKGNKIKLHTRVRDTGIGIPKDKINSIFEGFNQADNSTTRKYGGTGLGLSISKKIAAIMGGNVWAESEPGKGSVFHFTAWVEKAVIKHKKRHEKKNFKNKKVLIYDSNRASLKILSKRLKSIEMVVTKTDRAESVIEAIESDAKANKPYDICILDISDSDETGFETARKIRSSESSNIPIVALSSSVDISAKRCKEYGFNGFLPKPVSSNKLYKMIEWLFCESEKKPLLEDAVNTEIITQYSIREDIKHSVSILLAEDNLINQKLAEKLFTQAGYIVDTVNNGEEAVNMFLSNQNKYDIIFMDVQMPVLNGHEATKRLRGKGFKDIPIVAVTANVVKGSREECLEAGMNDYITKPIKREIIFQIINKWVIEKETT
jgi:CheY-like chemotaxis protein